jgi:tetratricopeptide (TPR) repeat protein
MQRSDWPAWFVGALLVSGAATAGDELPASQSATVIGAMNPLLSEGSQALERGRFAEGVRLTLAGLEHPATSRDRAAGHSNVCAGYVAMKRYEEALEHCNRALELDNTNWRTFNNRAAVFVGLKQYDLAMTDVNAGLELAPNSSTLHKSREVVIQHTNAASRDRRRKPKTA